MQNSQFSIEPLFDFQILCDTDIGLYRLIKRDYYDRDTFDNILFDSDDERFVKTMIVSRKEFNPLFIFCKDGIMSDKELDDLYQEFLDEEYDNILELSDYTTIMELASTANNANKIVNVSVLCKNELEKQWINKHNRKLKCIVSEYKDFDISRHDTIYIKDIYTLKLFKQSSIKTKNIIIPRYIFNLELYNIVEIPIIEVSKEYCKNNKFMIADIYKNIKIPVTSME